MTRSIRPTYPAIAKQQRIEGDVKIQADLDANGNVIRAKALSGPPMLREAASDAVRRWKYQPALLDGKPVPIQLQVTVKFRLN